MSPGALAVVGVIITAGLGLVGVLLGQLYARLAKLEARVGAATAYNRALWLWARKHIDLYYTHRRTGSPDPDPIPVEDTD